MNRNVLETQWPQIREILREKFANLTDEDVKQINGRYDQLVDKLQQKYGYSREEAEERIRNWNFDRLNIARDDTTRDERFRKENLKGRIEEEDNSSLYKWLLGLGIPLLLLGAYFLLMPTSDTTRTANTTTTSQQTSAEIPSDRVISEGLRNALLAQNIRGVQNIQIATRNGIVTLSGTVPDRETRASIDAAARNQPGVREVVNNLQIR